MIATPAQVDRLMQNRMKWLRHRALYRFKHRLLKGCKVTVQMRPKLVFPGHNLLIVRLKDHPTDAKTVVLETRPANPLEEPRILLETTI